MNYYEIHIGDYIKATAHLSMLEDAAYRRLMDAYYTREAPLPLDRKAVHKLARAQSKDERQAVDYILDEFFTQADDGWHQSRCDEEIMKYHEKAPRVQEKRENAKERQQRSRVRRAAMFDELRSHGITAPWDAKTSELQTLLSRAQERVSHAPVTRDDTATQSPVDSKPPISFANAQEIAPPVTAKSKSKVFASWLADIRKTGEKPVSAYQPVWAYAEQAGLPAEWIELAWMRFRQRYENDEKAKRKRYTDWRRVFLNAVEGNWLGLWCWSERDQAYRLTTVGVQAENALRGAA